MLVSVITPVLNGKLYISKAIESVLNQRYKQVEHIIVDGASTDGTIEILESYHRQFPNRVRYVSEPDQGPCHALNKGWQIAQGDIYGWLGADDLYPPDTLEHVTTFFKQNPKAFFVFGESDLIDAAGQWTGRFATRDFFIQEAINVGVYISFPAAFYKKEVVRKVGTMRQGDPACDTDFVIRVGRHFKLHRIDKILASFRLHPGGKTGGKGSAEYPRALYLINRRYNGAFWSPVCRRYFRSIFAKTWLFHQLQYALQKVWFLSDHRLQGRVAIFGASYSGSRCFDYLKKNGTEAVCFLDNYPWADRFYCGKPVLKPQVALSDSMNPIDIIVLASANSKNQMRQQLHQLGFRKPIASFDGERVFYPKFYRSLSI